MKLSKKILLRSIPVLLLLVVVLTGNVYGIEVAEPEGGTEISGITNLANNIWSTIEVIVQIAAIAAIVIAGVRYMFASADQKAELKKSLGILAVGAILVFGASTVVSFLTGAFNEIAGQ